MQSRTGLQSQADTPGHRRALEQSFQAPRSTTQQVARDAILHTSQQGRAGNQHYYATGND